MARRYRAHRSRRSSGLGGGSLMNGLLRPKGIIAAAIIGLGASALASYIPVNIPYKNTIAAFALGGVPGAVSAVLVGNMGAGASGTGIKLY